MNSRRPVTIPMPAAPASFPVLTADTTAAGLAHLRGRDPVLAAVIERAGAFTLKPGRLTADNVRRFTPEQLRTAGVSPQQASYLLDLAAKVDDGEVRLGHLHTLPDEGVIEELVRINGIGEWTAHMFLMFSLGRLDVLPHGDLGVRIALRDLYGLKDLPDVKRARKIAEKWRPYATIASWYCWRSLEFKKTA